MSEDRPTRVGTRTDLHEFDGRIRMLIALFALPMLVLVFKLWSLQIRQFEKFRGLAQDIVVFEVELEPDRGLILDSDGRVIAENRPSYDVYITPRAFFYARETENQTPDETLSARVEQLQRILNLAESGIERLAEARLEAEDEDAIVRNRMIARDVTRNQLAMLETHMNELPGTYVTVTPRRHYPFDSLGAHLLGFMGEINAEELEDLRDHGYRVGDYIGRTGLERAYERILRGAPGLERFVRDVQGVPQPEEISQQLLGNYRRVDPVPGRNIHLTVDMQLQAIVEEAAGDTVSGGIAVIDPRDGSVLSLYSRPGFNPNAWSGRLSREESRELQNNPFHPMLDKSVLSWFPASTYKVVTAFAALEEGLIDAETTITCNGRVTYHGTTFRCWNRHGHGPVNLAGALSQSCDVYFWELGVQVGIDRLADYARRFGFGAVPGVGINGESAGLVPTRAWHDENSPGGFRYGFTANTSVGQGDTRVSPLQLALAYGAIGNGGTLYHPRLIDRITSSDDRVLFEYPPRVRGQLGFTESHMSEVIQGLVDVLTYDVGTAGESALPYIDVAGKTGTAEVRRLETVRIENDEIFFRDRDHAWFVAYAPVENPVIAVAVFLEHGGQGSHSAAPVAMRIVDRYFREVLGWNDEIDRAIAEDDIESLQALWGRDVSANPDQDPFDMDAGWYLGFDPTPHPSVVDRATEGSGTIPPGGSVFDPDATGPTTVDSDDAPADGANDGEPSPEIP